MAPGVPIVLTAPLTESIDHAGFFIQMSLASIPEWMEWVIDRKYPSWRNVPISQGRAGTAPAGLRVLEAVLIREFGADSVVLDGPDRAVDPGSWEVPTLKAVARLCRRGTRLATWTVTVCPTL